MIDKIQFKRKISYIIFSAMTVTNIIGLIASFGTPSMYATALFALIHMAAFLTVCLWLKKYDLYLRVLLIIFVIIMFPLILWFSPVPKQVILYIFLIPSFYSVSIRRKRDTILPLLNGVFIACLLYLKVKADGGIIYVVIFLMVYIFCTLIVSLFSITLFNNMVELEKMNEIISDQARKDKLTGIYNRTGIEYALKGREKEPCYAIMIDIDFFKQVNDTHGHDAGDNVLMILGSILQKFASKDFIVSRRGGEEFLIYSFESYRETMDILEDIYGEVEKFLLVGSEHVHISAGVSGRGHASEELVSEADKNLYSSKQTGRNRITSQLP